MGGQLNHEPNDRNPIPGPRSHDTPAKVFVAGFPASVDSLIRRRPYASVGVACAIGVGAGVLLSHRILRAVLASTVGYAVVEFGRAYLRQNAAAAHDTGRPGTVAKP
jgi:hypothetical protein